MTEEQVPPAGSPRELLLDTRELAIGLALFVLARAERSRALLVFAAANLAALLAGSYNVGGLLREHGWAVPVAWTFMPRLWAAAAVLLLAGAAFAAAGRGRG